MIVVRLWLLRGPEHVRIVRCQAGGGVGPVGQPVLEPALHHVVVVQPTVGSHHRRLLLAENINFDKVLHILLYENIILPQYLIGADNNRNLRVF